MTASRAGDQPLHQRLAWPAGLAIAAALIAIQALTLHFQGHPAICTWATSNSGTAWL